MCTFWRAMRFSVCTVCLVCSGCGKLWGRWRRSTSLSKQRNMWSSCRSSGALNWLWTAVRQTPHHVSVCTAAVITHCAFTFCSPAHTCIPPSAVQTKQLKQWRALTLITKWWLKNALAFVCIFWERCPLQMQTQWSRSHQIKWEAWEIYSTAVPWTSCTTPALSTETRWPTFMTNSSPEDEHFVSIFSPTCHSKLIQKFRKMFMLFFSTQVTYTSNEWLSSTNTLLT